jgi:hypothetical protein
MPIPACKYARAAAIMRDKSIGDPVTLTAIEAATLAQLLEGAAVMREALIGQSRDNVVPFLRRAVALVREGGTI